MKTLYKHIRRGLASLAVIMLPLLSGCSREPRGIVINDYAVNDYPVKPEVQQEQTITSTRTNSFESYKSIIDREPFGKTDNPIVKTPTIPIVVTNSSSGGLRLCSLVDLNGRLYAGFQDQSNKTDFVLQVGEKTTNNLELVEVDYENESIILRNLANTNKIELFDLALTGLPVSTNNASTNRFSFDRGFFRGGRDRSREDRGSTGPETDEARNSRIIEIMQRRALYMQQMQQQQLQPQPQLY